MLRTSRVGLLALSLLLIAPPILMALLAPVVAPRGPLAQDFSRMLQPPGRTNLFGTDEFGRSVLNRVLWGSRPSLGVAFVALVIGGGCGVLLGLVAGFFGGALDTLSNRLIDGLLAFPTLIVAIAVVAILGGGTVPLVAAISVTLVPRFARVVRGKVLTLKPLDYVQAARAIGASDARILLRHVLPNTMGAIIVYATIHLPYAIFVESSLSFLGVGVAPDAATWGRVVADGRQYLQFAPWISFFPGLAIALTSVGFNLLGDSLRDMLDPKLRT